VLLTGADTRPVSMASVVEGKYPITEYSFVKSKK
jgi:hypothetical protein